MKKILLTLFLVFALMISMVSALECGHTFTDVTLNLEQHLDFSDRTILDLDENRTGNGDFRVFFEEGTNFVEGKYEWNGTAFNLVNQVGMVNVSSNCLADKDVIDFSIPYGQNLSQNSYYCVNSTEGEYYKVEITQNNIGDNVTLDFTTYSTNINSNVTLDKNYTCDLEPFRINGVGGNFNGNGFTVNGNLQVDTDSVLVKYTVINGVLTISNGGSTIYANNLQNITVTSTNNIISNNYIFGTVTDSSQINNKFCDYDDVVGSYNIYSGNGSYSGINIGNCPIYSDFTSATDFSSVSNWSAVDLVLGTSFGVVDFVGNVDLSGEEELDFNSWVAIADKSIFVDGSSPLNQSASITFTGLSATTLDDLTVYKDGVVCSSACSNLALSVGNLTLDVSSFSTYTVVESLGYVPTITNDDLDDVAIDGVGTLFVAIISFLGLIVLLFIVLYVLKKRKGFNKHG